MKKTIVAVMALTAAAAAFGVAYDPKVHGNPIEVTGDAVVEIDGQGATVDGGGKARCATLGPNVTLKNFTFTNGKADLGGGVCGGKIVNCTVSGCTASEAGAALFGTVAVGCTLKANRFANGDSTAAAHGGVACESTLIACTLTGNAAVFGSEAPAFGGVGDRVTVTDCAVSGNSVSCGDMVCYGLRFASSTVNGKYVELDDAIGTPLTMPANTYYVCFTGGDGATGEMPVVAWKRNKVYALPKNAFVRADKKTFRGWAGSNGRRYDGGLAVFNLAESGKTLVLTAIWQ